MDEMTKRLIEAGRTIVEKGLTWGTSGNLSVRRQDRVWITASGTRIGALTEEDIAELAAILERAKEETS